MHDDLLTAQKLGERLRLKPDTILGWARRGRIPAHRLSRKVIRFRLPGVVAALDRTEMGIPAPNPARGPGAGP